MSKSADSLLKRSLKISIGDLVVHILGIWVILKTSSFKEVDEAFFITAFILFIQAIITVSRYWEYKTEKGIRLKLSIVSILSSIVGAFIWVSGIWKWPEGEIALSILHGLVVVLLFFAYFRILLEDTLPIINFFKNNNNDG